MAEEKKKHKHKHKEKEKKDKAGGATGEVASFKPSADVKGIRFGGSSLSDYVDAKGQRGRMQRIFANEPDFVELSRLISDHQQHARA